MKNTLKIAFIASFTLFLLPSCSMSPCGYSKTTFIKKFNGLVGEVKAAKRKVSDEAWEKDDRKFEQLATDCYQQYEAEMTFEEKRDFWLNAFRYLWYRYGLSVIKEIRDPDTQEEIVRIFQENADAFIDFVEELKNITKEELKGLFE